MNIIAPSWLVYVLVVPLAFAAAWWFFRSVRQEIARRNAPPAWGTAVLPWLRAVLAGLLVLGFARPSYTRKTPVAQPGQVALVLDTESGMAQAPPESSPEQRLRLMRNLNLIEEKDADLKAMSLADEFAEAISAMKGPANEEKRKKRLAQWQEFVERQERQAKTTEPGRLPANWPELVQAKLVKPAQELNKKSGDQNLKTVLESAGELRDKLKARAMATAPAQLAAAGQASEKLQAMTGWERMHKLLPLNGLLNQLGKLNRVTLYGWHQGKLRAFWSGSPDKAPAGLNWPNLPLPYSDESESGMEEFNATFESGARRAMVLFSALGSDPAAPTSLTASFRPGIYPVHVVAVGASAGSQEGRAHLREIAVQSNGQFLREAETDRLPSLLADLVRQKTERQTHFFFHHATVYLLAAALFLTELFLRKRHGLL